MRRGPSFAPPAALTAPVLLTRLPPGFTGQSANNTFFAMGSAYSVSYWTTGYIADTWRSWVQKDDAGPGGFRIISNTNGSPTNH